MFKPGMSLTDLAEGLLAAAKKDLEESRTIYAMCFLVSPDNDIIQMNLIDSDDFAQGLQEFIRDQGVQAAALVTSGRARKGHKDAQGRLEADDPDDYRLCIVIHCVKRGENVFVVQYYQQTPEDEGPVVFEEREQKLGESYNRFFGTVFEGTVH